MERKAFVYKTSYINFFFLQGEIALTAFISDAVLLYLTVEFFHSF